GILSLSQGFLLTSMIFAAVLVFVIERRLLRAAAWLLCAAGLAYFGLIHAYTLTADGAQNLVGAGAAREFALAYLAIAAVLAWLHFLPSGKEAGASH
ncbi:MAG: NCS2 family permease, partial [Vicinamibacteria bacterium]|nr:NCS2 family permease [Vicinamibacteria bacterium]